MNVLLLTTGYPTADKGYGGAFVHSLALGLARRGHRLRVVVPARNDSMGPARAGGLPVWQFRYAVRRGGHRLTSIDGGIP